MKSSKQKKLIMLLVYSLGAGGAEKLVVDIARRINKEEFDVSVCSFKGGLFEENLVKHNIDYLVIGKKGRLDAAFPFKLLATVKTKKPDVLHAHLFSANFWGKLIGRVAGIRVILTTEHTVANHKSPLEKFIDRVTARLSDRIIAVSEEVRQSHIRDGRIPSWRIVTILNGIDTESIKTRTNPQESQNGLRRSLGVNRDDIVGITVGRMVRAKGHVYLLKALPRVVSELSAFKLLIVGAGPLGKNLKEICAELGIERQVIFTGYRRDVNELILASDLGIVPSLREGLSISLLEYLAHGKPVVATDAGSNARVIEHGVSGVIVSRRDSEALARAIIEIGKSRDLAGKLGQAGRERVESDYSLKNMIDRLEDLYRNTRKNSKRPLVSESLAMKEKSDVGPRIKL